MSLKGKLINTAGKYLVDKINKDGIVDNTVNSVINKMGKMAGMRTSDFERKLDKKYMFIKTASYSLESIIEILRTETSENIDNVNCKYKIYDDEDNLMYFSDYSISLITDRETISLYDSNKTKLGKVKQHLFGFDIPFLQKDAKKCTISLNNEKLCELQSYKMFEEKSIHVSGGDIHISFKKENKYEFEIKKGNNIIAKLNSMPPQFKNGYANKYVIEYSNVEYERIIVLLAIALDIVN